LRAWAAAGLVLVVLAAPEAEARTLSIAFVVHRDGAHLAAYTVKERPFVADAPDVAAGPGSRALRLHVVLHV